jgi:Protein of unknown function (DUF2971)
MTATPSEETLVQQFRGRLWQPASFDPADFMPSCVYHYTTAGGFEGILRHRFLRATNFSFLNDPSEVMYGSDLASKLLAEIKNSLSEPKTSLIDQILSSLDLEAVAEVYVACFTRLEDDLSQWRAYGSAALERYAIGFDAQELKTLSAEPNTNFVKVLYEHAGQLERIRFFVDRAFRFIERENVEQSQWPVLAGAVAQLIARVLPELKDPAYKTEREWRIIRWHAREDEPPEVDASRGVLRPFLKIMLPAPLPIIDLRVMAPTRKEKALKAAEMLLRGSQIEGVEVTHSTVPFAE